MSRQAFERVMVACTGGELDHALLEYAALLASGECPASVLVAATPAGRLLHSLAPAARAVFGRRRVDSLSFQCLTEPDLEAVFSAARNFQACLIVLRHPRLFGDSRLFAKRLLREPPCSICFVPDKCTPKIDRVIVGIPLNQEGRALVCQAARICSQVRGEELLAVHARYRSSTFQEERLEQAFREEALLELYRFVARADLGRVNCTPVLEADAPYGRALLQSVMKGSADLVVIGQPALPDLPLLSPPRKAEQLLLDCPVPLLQVRLAAEKVSLREILQKRVFGQPEPAFN